MGYHKLPSWSTSEDLGIPLIRKALSHDRFDSILMHLHVNDNSQMTGKKTDKLYKIRPLVTALNDNFPNIYKGTRELSIDESVNLFKGRSSIKQYNPMKPIKRGYKLWCIGDQRGYILKLDIYQGINESLEQEFRLRNRGNHFVIFVKIRG
ncbi:PiggyBac transposable element-derived protein 3 [Zootermopsis nevadensis]|uniref:PiggyBac transposable element-derived protein 3 n=1 Tax=Zootermopsis nevadensis TaxID=136037 RepID=A0A067RDX0_ZOONE|nr:PiggyBac transposable element-derived protein 3 [Zootermopsis nevadensis]